MTEHEDERLGHYQPYTHECPLGCCISLDSILENRMYDVEIPQPAWWRLVRRAYWRGHRDAALTVLHEGGVRSQDR